MSFRAVALGNDETTLGGDASFDITVPASVQAGDVLLVIASMNTGANTFTISGGGTGSWTTQRGPDDTLNALRTYLWTKTAAADAASSTVTVSSGGGGRFIGILLAQSGVLESGAVVGFFSDSSSDTSLNWPSVTVPADGWDVVGLGALRAATATPPAITGVPSGATLAGSSNTALGTSPNYCDAALYSNTTVTAGSRTLGSTGSGTANQAVTNNLYTVALAPAAPPAGSGGGSWSFTGAGSGTTIRSGSGPGGWSFTGSGTGTTARGGTGAGSVAFVGAGSGSRPAGGSGSGAWTFTGSGTGASVRSGSGGGSVAWTGAGSGLAPGDLRDITLTIGPGRSRAFTAAGRTRATTATGASRTLTATPRE